MGWSDLFIALGWLGQGFFFLRFLLQWLASERARRIVVPALFWHLSLHGAAYVTAYALFVRDPVFVAGPLVNLFIYGRNLALIRNRRPLSRDALLPFGLGLLAFAALVPAASLRFDQPVAWVVVGVTGQLCWISRFPLQWVVSERLGRATLPTSFFWISFAGSVLLLAYAIHLLDPIFIAGQALNPLLYGRNLRLSHLGRAPAPGVQGPLPSRPAT